MTMQNVHWADTVRIAEEERVKKARSRQAFDNLQTARANAAMGHGMGGMMNGMGNIGFQCSNNFGSYECQDVNECFEMPCDEGFACLNNDGGYRRV